MVGGGRVGGGPLLNRESAGELPGGQGRAAEPQWVTALS